MNLKPQFPKLILSLVFLHIFCSIAFQIKQISLLQLFLMSSHLFFIFYILNTLIKIRFNLNQNNLNLIFKSFLLIFFFFGTPFLSRFSTLPVQKIRMNKFEEALNDLLKNKNIKFTKLDNVKDKEILFYQTDGKDIIGNYHLQLWKYNNLLRVIFIYGGAFPVKHSAILYTNEKNSFIHSVFNDYSWRPRKKLKENWYLISD